MLRKVIGFAAIAVCSGAAAQAAVYTFDMTVQNVAVSGSFEIDDSSLDYVGGGTTNADDLLDYSLTFTSGANSVTGTPANQAFLQTFDITYSNDLSTVSAWDFSLGFNFPSGLLQFAGNNINNGGFAQIADNGNIFDAATFPAPTLTAELVDTGTTPVPLPAGLPLMVAALGLLGLAARRR